MIDIIHPLHSIDLVDLLPRRDGLRADSTVAIGTMTDAIPTGMAAISTIRMCYAITVAMKGTGTVGAAVKVSDTIRSCGRAVGTIALLAG